jgi:hypothetical protein
LAETLDEGAERLCAILRDWKKLLVHRALIASERSPGNFSEEIIALNDIDETLRNNCRKTG